MRHTLPTLQFRSCNRFPHNKTVSTVPALFITRVNNSAEYQCHWSNPSVCDLQLVCCRGKLRQVFPGTAAELEPCTTLQRALRIQSPLHQLDKEKPITYCYAALGKKCGDLLHFFTGEKKKKKHPVRNERRRSICERTHSLVNVQRPSYLILGSH